MTPHAAKAQEIAGAREQLPEAAAPRAAAGPQGHSRWASPSALNAGRRTHVMLAQLVWTIVGSMLLAMGMWWVYGTWGPRGLLYTVPFLLLGVAKGLLVLDRIARRTAERIDERGDDRFVLSFYSRRSWLIALGFMLLGQVLRLLPIPRPDLGLIYVMVGTGLVLGSRTMWQAWWSYRHPAGDE